jgi:hypothetical protein
VSGGRQGPFVQRCAVLRRDRLLPLPGEVLLEVGDRVESDTVVARAAGRGVLHTVNVARQLDVLPAEVPAAMRVAEGDQVAAGATLARTRGLWGLMAARCRAPVTATVVAISAHTGQVLLEEPARPLSVTGFLPGIVATVHPGRGVTVAGWAARVAGVLGVGGECLGTLTPAVGRRDAVLDAAQIPADASGAVLLGGALVTAAALARAAAAGAAGLITGGIHDADLSRWRGRDLVLADTTGQTAPLTLVVVGGFGRVPLDPAADALLREHAGRPVGLSAWTRVRAGAVRPEVLVPRPRDAHRDAGVVASAGDLAPGARVQVVAPPWFGRLGRVARLPDAPVTLESGARCRVAEVDLDQGDTVQVARANLEVLAGPERQEER